MAKARSGGKARSGAAGKAARGRSGGGTSQGGTSSRSMPSKSGVGKGEGLEVGNARREAGGSTGTRPTARRAPSGKAAAQIPGEKAVKRTTESLPVEPERDAPGEVEPMPPEALDQRRQVVGTDDPKGRTTTSEATRKRR